MVKVDIFRINNDEVTGIAVIPIQEYLIFGFRLDFQTVLIV